MKMPCLISEQVAAKRGIGSTGLQGYRDTAVEQVSHASRSGWHVAGDEVFLPLSS
jgi:hypothetical protein